MTDGILLLTRNCSKKQGIKLENAMFVEVSNCTRYPLGLIISVAFATVEAHFKVLLSLQCSLAKYPPPVDTASITLQCGSGSCCQPCCGESWFQWNSPRSTDGELSAQGRCKDTVEPPYLLAPRRGCLSFQPCVLLCLGRSFHARCLPLCDSGNISHLVFC